MHVAIGLLFTASIGWFLVTYSESTLARRGLYRAGLAIAGVTLVATGVLAVLAGLGTADTTSLPFLLPMAGLFAVGTLATLAFSCRSHLRGR